MNAFLQWFSRNWRTNTAALISIIYSADQFTTAVQAWSRHEPTNWRTAILSLIVAAGLFVAKDAHNHSTQAEVQAATLEKKP